LYRLSLVGVGANSGRSECEHFDRANDLRSGGKLAGALSEYEEFLWRYADSNLSPKAAESAALVLVELGRASAQSSEWGDALSSYSAVLTDYPQTTSARVARARLDELWTKAVRRPAPCQAVGNLDRIIAVPFDGQRTKPRQVGESQAQTGDTAGRGSSVTRYPAAAQQRLPTELLSCGRDSFVKHRLSLALASYRRLSSQYRDSPLARDARREAIQVQVTIAFGRNPKPIPPAKLRQSAASGTVSVGIAIGAPAGVRLFVSGPGVGKVVVLPRCPSCRIFRQVAKATCPSSATTRWIQLPPGTYDVLWGTKTSIWSVAGAGYVHCLFQSVGGKWHDLVVAPISPRSYPTSRPRSSTPTPTYSQPGTYSDQSPSTGTYSDQSPSTGSYR
jgi:hypothetical protein